MSRSNEFAQVFANAHTEAGLQRVSIAHILQKVQSDPSFIFSEELRTGAGLCPMRRKTDADDADKVTVNTLLAYLFERLRDHIAKALPLDEARRVMLPIPPRSPHGLDPADRAAMATASSEALAEVLRDSTCHLLDGLITGWAAELLAEEEFYRAQGSGEISSYAAATFVLRNVLEDSAMYQRAGYDMLSITKTGSHTAIHICWALVEAAPLLVPGKDPAFYDDLVRRSLKQIVPLSMASLGMLVHYMEGSGIEPHDGLAIHLLPKNQTAFQLDENGLICLNPEPIQVFAKRDEQRYTGCPAFYTPNLIKLYLDIVASLAMDYGIYDRLQGR